jgi:hypothetical protein
VCSARLRALLVSTSITILISRLIVQLEPALALISTAPSYIICAETVALARVHTHAIPRTSSCSLLHSLTISGDRSNQAVENHSQAQQPHALPAITASAQILPFRDLGPLINLSQAVVQQYYTNVATNITGAVWMLH